MESLKNLCISKINNNIDINIDDNCLPHDLQELIKKYKRKCWHCDKNNAQIINWGKCFLGSKRRGFLTVLCLNCFDGLKSNFRTSVQHCFSCFKKYSVYDIIIERYYLDNGNFTNLCSICINKNSVINCDLKITHKEIWLTGNKCTYIPFKK